MTHPLHAVHNAVWRTVSSTLATLRSQAPGARMIGEFAVKHVVRQARERVTATSPTKNPNDQSQS